MYSHNSILGRKVTPCQRPPFYGLRKRIWMIESTQALNSSSPKYLFVNTIKILSFDLKVGTKELLSPPEQLRLDTFTKSPPQPSACGCSIGGETRDMLYADMLQCKALTVLFKMSCVPQSRWLYLLLLNSFLT